jgi:hypothetical protein
MVPVPNRILIDLTPMRDSRGFRMLFAGPPAGVLGSQIAPAAVPFQVYDVPDAPNSPAGARDCIDRAVSAC